MPKTELSAPFCFVSPRLITDTVFPSKCYLAEFPNKKLEDTSKNYKHSHISDQSIFARNDAPTVCGSTLFADKA